MSASRLASGDGPERGPKSGAPEQLQLFGPRRYVTVEEVAALIGVPKSFIYRRTARGHNDPIPCYRLGSHLRFKLEDIEAWLEKHRHEPAPARPLPLVAAHLELSSRRSKTTLQQPRAQRSRE